VTSFRSQRIQRRGFAVAALKFKDFFGRKPRRDRIDDKQNEQAKSMCDECGSEAIQIPQMLIILALND
jgi:hypothetical protein